MTNIIEFRPKEGKETKNPRLDGLAACADEIVKKYGAERGIMILKDAEGEIRIGTAVLNNDEIRVILGETLYCFHRSEREKEQEGAKASKPSGKSSKDFKS